MNKAAFFCYIFVGLGSDIVVCFAMVPATYFANVIPIEGHGNSLRFFTQEQIEGIMNKVDDPVLPAIRPTNVWHLINKFGFVSLPVSAHVLDLLYELSKVSARNTLDRAPSPSLVNFFREHSFDLQSLGFAINALASLRAKNILEKVVVQIYPKDGGLSWVPGRIQKTDGRMSYSANNLLPVFGRVIMKLLNGQLIVEQQNYGVSNQTFSYKYN